MKLDFYLILFTNINSKSINNLNVKLEVKEFLEKIMGKILLYMSRDNDFLDMISNTQAKNPKIIKWDYMKLEVFCIIAKETINKINKAT